MRGRGLLALLYDLGRSRLAAVPSIWLCVVDLSLNYNLIVAYINLSALPLLTKSKSCLSRLGFCKLSWCVSDLQSCRYLLYS